MNAPPQTGWLGRTFGELTSRENRTATAGVAAWLILGAILYFTCRTVSLGTAILLGSLWILSLAVFAGSAMRNLFGPVFIYEAVRVGRRKFTFILRTIYLIVLTIVLTLLFFNWLKAIGYDMPDFQGIRPNQLSQYGEQAFLFFAPIQFGFICLITPAYVAGIIADEKERKTLEFLFATDLRNREIIFGKLAARIVTLLMYIVAGLPVLSSLMLFGGIDPEMLLAAYAATIVTMLGLAAMSIYYSTAVKKPRDAIVLSYFTAGLYLIVTSVAPMFLLAFPRMYGPLILLGVEIPLDTMGNWLGAGNPIFVIIQIIGFGSTIEDLAPKYALTYAVFIVAFLGYSILRLRSIALQQSYGAVGGGKSKRDKKANAHPTCGSAPIFWKEVFIEGSNRRGWSRIAANILLVIMTFIWPAIIFANTHFDSNYAFTGFTARNNKYFQEGTSIWLRLATAILGFLMMMGAAVRGASAVTSEKDRDTWVSLIASPLSSWEILIGKWWGAVLSTRRFGWILISVWAFSMFVGAVYSFMLIPTAIYLALYIAVFAWMGIFCSCTARNTLIASIRIMMAGLFFSGGFWLLLACCCFMPMSISRGGNDSAEFIGVSFLSLTPPMVCWWMPLNGFDRSAMSPFHPEDRPHMGPMGIALGFFLWAGFGAILAGLSMASFQKQANRSNDALPEREAPKPIPAEPDY